MGVKYKSLKEKLGITESSIYNATQLNIERQTSEEEYIDMKISSKFDILFNTLADIDKCTIEGNYKLKKVFNCMLCIQTCKTRVLLNIPTIIDGNCSQYFIIICKSCLANYITKTCFKCHEQYTSLTRTLCQNCLSCKHGSIKTQCVVCKTPIYDTFISKSGTQCRRIQYLGETLIYGITHGNYWVLHKNKFINLIHSKYDYDNLMEKAKRFIKVTLHL